MMIAGGFASAVIEMCRVLGLSCRCLYGAVRQQCAGHLPFERRETANGGFSVLPTGTTTRCCRSALREAVTQRSAKLRSFSALALSGLLVHLENCFLTTLSET